MESIDSKSPYLRSVGNRVARGAAAAAAGAVAVAVTVQQGALSKVTIDFISRAWQMLRESSGASCTRAYI